MMKKYSMLYVIAVLFFLSGCANFKVFHPAVQQGNVITASEVKKIKLGMHKKEVKRILGYPVLSNKFMTNKVNYIYTFKEYDKPLIEKKLILLFEKDILTKINYSPLKYPLNPIKTEKKR